MSAIDRWNTLGIQQIVPVTKPVYVIGSFQAEAQTGIFYVGYGGYQRIQTRGGISGYRWAILSSSCEEVAYLARHNHQITEAFGPEHPK
jgi:hypothetical protein